MSLSQKHSGKVLVPWFNIAEWQAVYNLIYNENQQNHRKALEILKIWKLRTPLLSAGVEGTLIVLEALLINSDKLSYYETTHILSTSLLRFLNLCAANNAKQGTFYKTAMKNDLPNWLISVRHDIAHSHRVPSKSMLELSLTFCLEWLQEKYWHVQLNEMSDLIIKESDNLMFDDVFFIFVQLTENLAGSNTDNLVYDGEFLECLNRMPKVLHKKQFSNRKLLENVMNILKETIKNNPGVAADRICKCLIDNFQILTDQTIDISDKGVKSLSKGYVSKWKNLINLLHETEILPKFVQNLFNFICNNSNDYNHQEIASLWIKEIYQALSNHTQTGTLYFNSSNDCMKDKNFVTEICEKYTGFTLNFLRPVLEYNEAPPPFIEDIITIISATNTSGNAIKVNGMFTVGDINHKFCPNEDVPCFNKNTTEQNSRWQIIEDTSSYRNLPLGILPHQPRNVNPALEL